MKSRYNIIFKIIEKIYLSFENNLVYYDELTKCYNMRFYNNIIEKKYKDKSIILGVVDIDNLKQVNDNISHHAGSELLINVARQLKQCSELVIRYGGDEFILINPDENKLRNIKNISYGLYNKNNYETLLSAFRNADRLMYDMKTLHHSKEILKHN